MTAGAAAPDRRQLARLLRRAGSALGPEEAAKLVAGVLAAPPEIGTSWHALVTNPTPPALAEALEQLKDYLATDYRDGVSPEDFKRLPSAARVALLREELARRKLDAFIVPRSDEHQGEYVPPAGQRLAWLTGFTGSAGLAVVLADRAALFVDGRYTLQAAQQVDAQVFEVRHLVDEPASKWLGSAPKRGMGVGYAPGAAPAGGGRARPRRRRARRGEPAPGRGESARQGLGRTAAGAAGARGAASR